MPSAIRTAALAAVAEHGVGAPAQLNTIQAIKATKDATGCSLAEARDAVMWAKDRPSAASLPFGSIVVGQFAAAWAKEEESDLAARPWTATHIAGTISDAEVDEALQDGRATVLRVGTGA